MWSIRRGLRRLFRASCCARRLMLSMQLSSPILQEPSPEPWIPPPWKSVFYRPSSAITSILRQHGCSSRVYEQSTDAATVKASTREVIARSTIRSLDVEKEIRQHFDDHPDLKTKTGSPNLDPGIGETTAGSLLAEIPHLNRFESAKAVAAYAGLSPRQRRSGTSVHGRPRLCKTGNSRIRKALYMPAIVALRFNPVLKIFADRLAALGKHKRLIIGAVMRKLLVLSYGVLRSGKRFDPNYA